MKSSSDLASIRLHATAVVPRNSVSQDMAGGEEPAENKFDEKIATEKALERDSSNSSIADDEPTEEDIRTLRKVPDSLPISTFLIAMVELCERFAYYGLTGPFQNYMQNPRDDQANPGAIGLGQTGATGLSNFFSFWCYLTPILGAIISDQYIGKYNTIFYAAFVYLAGIIILVATSTPAAIDNGAALGGLIAAMIVMGFGAGGIKANVAPLIAEQYQGTRQKVKVLKSGERVIIDPGLTIQRIYMFFYLCINVGSLSSIATTEMERNIDFWAAYTLPACMFVVGLAVLVFGKKVYVVRPPQGSVVMNAFKVLFIAIRHKGKLDAAKPSMAAEYGAKNALAWDDQFVDELKRALVAMRVFCFYPIYWVVYSQMLNNFISQAGDMELHGIPNDLMQNIDPIAIIIFIPLCDKLLYPGLRRIGIQFKPITRITWGFYFAAASMAYAAGVQKLIYEAGPCYEAPLACAASDDGSIPNRVHVAIQTPAYVLIGLSEIFASITGLEYAFTKAPPSMKSFVQAMFLLTSAIGSALAIALSPTAVDPKLLWMYTGLCVATVIAGVAFWFCFKKYNYTEDEMNNMEDDGVKAVKASEVTTVAHSQALQRARSATGRNESAV